MQRHKMDPLSLTFGLGFVALGLVFLTMDLDFSVLRPKTLVPVVMVFIGLLLLLTALNRTRARDDLALEPDPAPGHPAAAEADEEDEEGETPDGGPATSGGSQEGSGPHLSAEGIQAPDAE